MAITEATEVMRHLPPNKSAEATAVGAVGFRCRGSRRESAVAQLSTLGSIERFIQAEALKIVMIMVGIILLAVGLLNIVPDVWRFIHSNTASTTLMIRTHWILMVVCGALLCIVGFFVRSKQG